MLHLSPARSAEDVSPSLSRVFDDPTGDPVELRCAERKTELEHRFAAALDQKAACERTMAKYAEKGEYGKLTREMAARHIFLEDTVRHLQLKLCWTQDQLDIHKTCDLRNYKYLEKLLRDIESVTQSFDHGDRDVVRSFLNVAGEVKIDFSKRSYEQGQAILGRRCPEYPLPPLHKVPKLPGAEDQLPIEASFVVLEMANAIQSLRTEDGQHETPYTDVHEVRRDQAFLLRKVEDVKHALERHPTTKYVLVPDDDLQLSQELDLCKAEIDTLRRQLAPSLVSSAVQPMTTHASPHRTTAAPQAERITSPSPTEPSAAARERTSSASLSPTATNPQALLPPRARAAIAVEAGPPELLMGATLNSESTDVLVVHTETIVCANAQILAELGQTDGGSKGANKLTRIPVASIAQDLVADATSKCVHVLVTARWENNKLCDVAYAGRNFSATLELVAAARALTALPRSAMKGTVSATVSTVFTTPFGQKISAGQSHQDSRAWTFATNVALVAATAAAGGKLFHLGNFGIGLSNNEELSKAVRPAPEHPEHLLLLVRDCSGPRSSPRLVGFYGGPGKFTGATMVNRRCSPRPGLPSELRTKRNRSQSRAACQQQLTSDEIRERCQTLLALQQQATASAFEPANAVIPDGCRLVAVSCETTLTRYCSDPFLPSMKIWLPREGKRSIAVSHDEAQNVVTKCVIKHLVPRSRGHEITVHASVRAVEKADFFNSDQPERAFVLIAKTFGHMGLRSDGEPALQGTDAPDPAGPVHIH